MIQVTLLGRMLSTNHIYGQTEKTRYLKAPAKRLKASYIEQIQDQYWQDPIKYDVIVEASIYRYGIEKDIDNSNKLRLDAFNGLIREDDKQVKLLILHKVRQDNKYPRILIKVIPYDNSNSYEDLLPW